MATNNNFSKVVVLMLAVLLVAVSGCNETQASVSPTVEPTLAPTIVIKNIATTTLPPTTKPTLVPTPSEELGSTSTPIAVVEIRSLDELITTVNNEVIAGAPICGTPKLGDSGVTLSNGFKYLSLKTKVFPDLEKILCQYLIIMPNEHTPTVTAVYLRDGVYLLENVKIEKSLLNDFWKKGLTE